jgi:hypothetical protein
MTGSWSGVCLKKKRSTMRCIVLYGFSLAILSGLTFAQSQPASPAVTERERILLERIERLERRVNELESRLESAARAAGTAASQSPSPQPANAERPNAAAPPLLAVVAPSFLGAPKAF